MMGRTVRFFVIGYISFAVFYILKHYLRRDIKRGFYFDFDFHFKCVAHGVKHAYIPTSKDFCYRYLPNSWVRYNMLFLLLCYCNAFIATTVVMAPLKSLIRHKGVSFDELKYKFTYPLFGEAVRYFLLGLIHDLGVNKNRGDSKIIMQTKSASIRSFTKVAAVNIVSIVERSSVHDYTRNITLFMAEFCHALIKAKLEVYL